MGDDSDASTDADADELPPVLWDREDEVAALFDAAPGLLFCSDFDGTLTAIVDDPDAPEIRPDCADALRRLGSLDGVRVALVSGRELADLRDRAGIEGVGYAGNHGLEMVLHEDHGDDLGEVWADVGADTDNDEADAPASSTAGSDDVTVHPVAAARMSDIERVCELVRERLELDGLHVESKDVTATVHYRNVAGDPGEEVLETVESVVEEVAEGRLHVSEGKAIVEVGPAIPWDKGKAVDVFAADVPDDWLVVYVGDDTTDEHAFRSLDPTGLSIHVGEDPETDARYRLRDPEDVEEFLKWVVDRLDV
ncbi:trehalose-phosphatase [Halobium salinum]|uniref:Trehalose 6-phosphate phosphatase n=1 Tax=Halobium salinum TaxID=1364940 RepID=A0ABD5PB45_9EURY|nr:trehalose-phosphatase [Halobium salinum]